MFLAALMVMSVVALGFLAPAAAVTGDDSEPGTASIEGTTTDSTFSPLNYAANDGNSAFVDTNGLLVAINDWRNDNIETDELLDVINLWRSGESLLEVHFEDQDSIGGDTVEVAEAFVSEDVAEEYIVAIEEDGEVLSDSGVLSGMEADIEVSDLDLDVEVGDTEENLTAVLHEVDDGERGDAFTTSGEAITDTAVVTVVLEGLFLFNDTYTDLDPKIASGENANVTVGVNAVSEVAINGTITLVDSDFEEIEEREVGPGKDEELFVEEFELNKSDLATGENFTYTALVETEETPEIVESRDGTILVQGLSLAEQALGENNSEDAIIVEEVYAEENQTIEVRDDTDDVVGSTELSEALANESAVVEVTTDPGEHTAVLLDEEGEEVTADGGDIYDAVLSFADQTYQSSTDEVIVETADLLDGVADDTTFTIDVHPTDEDGEIIPDEAVGQSGNLTGANTDVTVNLDENVAASDDYVAMVHLGESGEPLDTDPLLSASEGELSPVVDPAKVTIVEGETGELVAPDSAERLSEITVSTVVTAQEVLPEDEDEVDIEARYIFDGEQEDSQTVTLGTGEEETVEFEFTLPGSLTAGENGTVEHSIETDEREASANLTLTNSIQTAVDYASAGETVDVEEGTYEESVTVDVEDLTIESQEGADVVVNATGQGVSAFHIEETTTLAGLAIVGDSDETAVYAEADVTVMESEIVVSLSEGTDKNPRGLDVRDGVASVSGVTVVGNHEGVTDSILDAEGFIQGVALTDASGSTLTDVTFEGELGDAVQILRSDNVEITESEFDGTATDDDQGVAVNVGGSDGSVAGGDGLVVTESNVTSYGTALYVNDESATDISFNWNNVEDADGLDNGTLAAVEAAAVEENVSATENWWGDESGPSGDGPGVGVSVSEFVDFDPWLDAPVPDGEPVTDRDWEVGNLKGDTAGERGTTIQLSATVENDLQSALDDEDGREVEVRHVLSYSDGTSEQLNAKTIRVVPGEEKRVNFTSLVPASEELGDDPDAEHRVRVEGEFRGKAIDISQGFGDVNGTVSASGETVLGETPGAGEGIENATVDVYAFADSADGNATVTATTDSDGAYEFDDLPYGEHFVTVEADDFVGEERVVLPETNELVTEAFALDYDGGGALGGAVELETVDPAEDIEVTVEIVETENSTTELLAGDNTTVEFLFDDVPVNVDEGYTVTASAESYDDDTVQNVTVDQGETTEAVNLSLSRETGSIDGTVTASGETTIENTPGTGDGISEATVTVYGFANETATDEYWSAEVQTDENGSYEVEDVPVTTASTHVVEVEATNFTAANVTGFEVDTGEHESADFALAYAEGGEFTGTIELDTVDSAEDVEVNVSVRDEQGEVLGKSVWVESGESNSTYTLADIPVSVEDAYDVTFEAENYLPSNFSSTVDVGQVIEEDVVLARETGEINGTVTASEDGFSTTSDDRIGPGDPLENVTVELYAFQDSDDHDPVASVRTDATGEYSFEDVPVTSASDHFVQAVDGAGFSAPTGQNTTVSAEEATTVAIEMVAQEVGITADAFLEPGAPEDEFTVTYQLINPEGDVERTRTVQLQEGETDVNPVDFNNLSPLQPDEVYNVTVLAEGYEDGMDSTYVAPGQSEGVELTLTGGELDLARV